MSTKNDGGPAFPVVAENGLGHIDPGMSLRDWFAGQIMATILQDAVLPTPELRAEWLPKAAGVAYEAADAILKAREA